MRDNPRLAAILDRKDEIAHRLKSGKDNYRSLYMEMCKHVQISYPTFCRYMRNHIQFNKPTLRRWKTEAKPAAQTTQPVKLDETAKGWDECDLDTFY